LRPRTVHSADGSEGILKPGAWEPAPKAAPIKEDLTRILAKLAQNPAKVVVANSDLCINYRFATTL